MNRLKVLAAASVMALATAFAADAATIAPGSRVDISSVFGGGLVTLVDSSGTAVDISSPSSVALDFNGTATAGLGSATIALDAVTGTFATIFTSPTAGTINGFTFSPFSPVTPLYTLASPANFAFDLTSITNIFRTATGFELAGTGVFRVDGYDNAAGTFAFSTQLASGGTAVNLSFSANSVAVPEPATLALFGTALLGLGFAGRSRRKAS